MEMEVEVPVRNVHERFCCYLKVPSIKEVMALLKAVQENYFYLVSTTLYKIAVAAINVHYGFGNSFNLFFAINLVFLGGIGLIFIIVSTALFIYNACYGKCCELGRRTLTFAMIYGLCGSILNLCLIPFYEQCEKKGYVMTDDYFPTFNSTYSSIRVEHPLKCTQFASWGTLAGVLLDIFLLGKGLLNLMYWRRTGVVMLFGIPSIVLWPIVLSIDTNMGLMTCCKFKSFTRQMVDYIDEQLMKVEDDWI